MNFLERLEVEAHQEEDTEAWANCLSKISSQVGNVMLLGPPLGGPCPGASQQCHRRVATNAQGLADSGLPVEGKLSGNGFHQAQRSFAADCAT